LAEQGLCTAYLEGEREAPPWKAAAGWRGRCEGIKLAPRPAPLPLAWAIWQSEGRCFARHPLSVRVLDDL